jgi:hypothetical protein
MAPVTRLPVFFLRLPVAAIDPLTNWLRAESLVLSAPAEVIAPVSRRRIDLRNAPVVVTEPVTRREVFLRITPTAVIEPESSIDLNVRVLSAPAAVNVP